MVTATHVCVKSEHLLLSVTEQQHLSLRNALHCLSQRKAIWLSGMNHSTTMGLGWFGAMGQKCSRNWIQEQEEFIHTLILHDLTVCDTWCASSVDRVLILLQFCICIASVGSHVSNEIHS